MTGDLPVLNVIYTLKRVGKTPQVSVNLVLESNNAEQILILLEDDELNQHMISFRSQHRDMTAMSILKFIRDFGRGDIGRGLEVTLAGSLSLSFQYESTIQSVQLLNAGGGSLILFLLKVDEMIFYVFDPVLSKWLLLVTFSTSNRRIVGDAFYSASTKTIMWAELDTVECDECILNIKCCELVFNNVALSFLSSRCSHHVSGLSNGSYIAEDGIGVKMTVDPSPPYTIASLTLLRCSCQGLTTFPYAANAVTRDSPSRVRFLASAGAPDSTPVLSANWMWVTYEDTTNSTYSTYHGNTDETCSSCALIASDRQMCRLWYADLAIGSVAHLDIFLLSTCHKSSQTSLACESIDSKRLFLLHDSVLYVIRREFLGRVSNLIMDSVVNLAPLLLSVSHAHFCDMVFVPRRRDGRGAVLISASDGHFFLVDCISDNGMDNRPPHLPPFEQYSIDMSSEVIYLAADIDDVPSASKRRNYKSQIPPTARRVYCRYTLLLNDELHRQQHNQQHGSRDDGNRIACKWAVHEIEVREAIHFDFSKFADTFKNTFKFRCNYALISSSEKDVFNASFWVANLSYGIYIINRCRPSMVDSETLTVEDMLKSISDYWAAESRSARSSAVTATEAFVKVEGLHDTLSKDDDLGQSGMSKIPSTTPAIQHHPARWIAELNLVSVLPARLPHLSVLPSIDINVETSCNRKTDEGDVMDSFYFMHVTSSALRRPHQHHSAMQMTEHVNMDKSEPLIVDATGVSGVSVMINDAANVSVESFTRELFSSSKAHCAFDSLWTLQSLQLKHIRGREHMRRMMDGDGEEQGIWSWSLSDSSHINNEKAGSAMWSVDTDFDTEGEALGNVGGGNVMARALTAVLGVDFTKTLTCEESVDDRDITAVPEIAYSYSYPFSQWSESSKGVREVVDKSLTINPDKSITGWPVALATRSNVLQPTHTLLASDSGLYQDAVLKLLLASACGLGRGITLAADFMGKWRRLGCIIAFSHRLSHSANMLAGNHPKRVLHDPSSGFYEGEEDFRYDDHDNDREEMFRCTCADVAKAGASSLSVVAHYSLSRSSSPHLSQHDNTSNRSECDPGIPLLCDFDYLRFDHDDIGDGDDFEDWSSVSTDTSDHDDQHCQSNEPQVNNIDSLPEIPSNPSSKQPPEHKAAVASNESKINIITLFEVLKRSGAGSKKLKSFIAEVRARQAAHVFSTAAHVCVNIGCPCGVSIRRLILSGPLPWNVSLENALNIIRLSSDKNKYT